MVIFSFKTIKQLKSTQDIDNVIFSIKILAFWEFKFFHRQNIDIIPKRIEYILEWNLENLSV